MYLPDCPGGFVMTDYAFHENDHSYAIIPTDVMTGDRNRRMQLYYQLVRSISDAKRIDIIVSFLMESGVRMLLKDLESALDRGVSVRILTGNYLGITQPSALYLIKQKTAYAIMFVTGVQTCALPIYER